MDFALNATAIGQNLNATYPGGEDDAACIPKMANLNTRVGPHTSLGLKPSHPPSLPWPLTHTPLYATVIFSMMPVRVHNPSMKITHSMKPSGLSGGHLGNYQVANDRQVSSDPWAQHWWHSAVYSEIISFAHNEQVMKLKGKAWHFY